MVQNPEESLWIHADEPADIFQLSLLSQVEQFISYRLVWLATLINCNGPWGLLKIFTIP
jgi:hypothetical protein